MEIEGTASRLITLAAKPTLTKSEHAEVKKIMSSLKKAGMSNEEIAKLSKGKWSESTVKGYVRGVKSAAQSPWQDAVSLLDAVINAGLTLDEIDTAVAVHKELESNNVDLGEVVEILEVAKSGSLDVKTLIKQYEALKSSGLSLKEVADILSLKRNLEERGLGLDSLEVIIKLAEKYGQPQKIIEAVSEYGSLAKLREETITVNGELKGAKDEFAAAQKQLQDLKTQITQSKEPLETLKEANVLGFGHAELLKVSTLAKKYGTVSKVIEAVEAYGNYSDITQSIDKAKGDLSNVLEKTRKTEAEHSHLKSAVTMCDTLIYQYKFGLDAIATIFSVAQKFGDAMNVLKAIEAYGRLDGLQQEIVTLEARIAEKNKSLHEANGRYQQELSDLDSLSAQALKTGQDVGRLQSEIKQSKGLERIFNLINDPESASYEVYGPLVLAMAVSLRKFVLVHEQRFKFPGSIKSGFDSLIKDLGGK
jgi:predicted  nucleic acid-binding Zn-ribbon protein